MGNYCVYKHTAPNGKVYIGITSRKPEKRWRKDGSGYITSPHFFSAIQKYGWNAFNHDILFVGLTKDEACEKEKALIAEYNSADRRFGYNATLGGETGLKITEEVKEKLRALSVNYYSDPKNRAAQKYRALGYKHTKEAKVKIRLSNIGKHRSLSPDHIKHISEGRKARAAIDNSFREALASNWANVGRKKSRPVQQLTIDGELIAEYESLHEADRVTGVRNGNISKCCNGITKTAGGYVWRYANSNISAVEKPL